MIRLRRRLTDTATPTHDAVDPLAMASPGSISPSLADLATLYGVDEQRLGRLATFAAQNPEIAGELGDRIDRLASSLHRGHPGRTWFADRRHESSRWSKLADLLLCGRLDDHLVERTSLRMADFYARGASPTDVFPWASLLPQLVAERAMARQLSPPVASELLLTASRVCTIVVMIGTRTFNELHIEQLTSLEELRSASNELAHLARSLEELAYSGGPDALEGRVETAISALDQVTTNAAGIGQIIELIGSIAAQTNLLALNATIEAARAGQEGKGFAVVASEVKNLASMTRSSLGDIERLVGEMQHSVETATASVSGVESATEALRSAAQSMSQLSGQLQGRAG